MPRKIYKPLNYESEDTVLDPAVAYVQAARALDVAAERAVELNDGETLSNVAALWIKIAESLTGEADDEEEEKKEEHHEAASIGFQLNGKEETIAADAEEGRDGEHEDLQGRGFSRLGGNRYRVHPQPRQL